MKYYVAVISNYGNTDFLEFLTKEEALSCVATNTGEDIYCKLIEGKEILFSIKQVAQEVFS